MLVLLFVGEVIGVNRLILKSCRDAPEENSAMLMVNEVSACLFVLAL